LFGATTTTGTILSGNQCVISGSTTGTCGIPDGSIITPITVTVSTPSQTVPRGATFFTIIPIAIALIIVVSRFIRVNEEVEKERQPEDQEHGRLSVETDQKRFESKDNKTNNNIGSKDRRSVVDIKGAITLAVTVTSFLLVLTYLETGGNGGTSTGSLQTIVFLIIGIISLALFILLEKRSTNPLVDFRLLLHKTVLPANLIIMIVGFSMFMVFQTIPILAR
jgi:hypothetical protein